MAKTLQHQVYCPQIKTELKALPSSQRYSASSCFHLLWSSGHFQSSSDHCPCTPISSLPSICDTSLNSCPVHSLLTCRQLSRILSLLLHSCKPLFQQISHITSSLKALTDWKILFLMYTHKTMLETLTFNSYHTSLASPLRLMLYSNKTPILTVDTSIRILLVDHMNPKSWVGNV